MLDSEDGERRFTGHEHTVEDIATDAWRQRTLIAVCFRDSDPYRLEKIQLK